MQFLLFVLRLILFRWFRVTSRRLLWQSLGIWRASATLKTDVGVGSEAACGVSLLKVDFVQVSLEA
ncbi:hypothetical protein KC19_VG061000 [Ceratodon purpureus]|uniref:Secreted protein n=1 Tax=Ceratodon purpureus TaxID=3225 RepID=A0A8T0HMI6_CERPU|nr:hypothetical protein KC19_VG061000 [Ceratodon purpureus]